MNDRHHEYIEAANQKSIERNGKPLTEDMMNPFNVFFQHRSGHYRLSDAGNTVFKNYFPNNVHDLSGVLTFRNILYLTNIMREAKVPYFHLASSNHFGKRTDRLTVYDDEITMMLSLSDNDLSVLQKSGFGSK